ncbi:hypothetical protein CFC21_044579 [Triticum aestivum]|uniref:Uncharacterized protein n=2 Tax=Triticum aestivum TaxID=4565 RepID=A0A3B6U4I0_WHEAT|nr:uncharacterized protein LOC123172475 [Triticum aestivum]XP_044445370.1 uncharacterized protein LOC123172475 [Triticum aestivum]KAF7033491.1 hypothetical protein CFC21_044579 [Triticum aestivum]
MAAALWIAAKRICGGALERPPQGLLSAAKELTSRTSNGGSSLRRFGSSESPSLLNKNNKHGAKSAASIAESSTQVKHPASSSPRPPKDEKQFLATVMKLTLGAVVFTVAGLYVEAKYIINGPFLGRERPVEDTGERSDAICFIK